MILYSTSSYVHFQVDSLRVPSYTGVWGRGCQIWSHTQLYITWMKNELEYWCFLLSRALQATHEVSKCPSLWPTATPLTFLYTIFYMIISGVFNTIFFFLSLKKNTFYSPLHCELSKHWSIWFKGKTKSKHRRPNYALCGKDLCECGLKKWVESQEENDMDFLEQTEEKSRSNFSTSQLCHCPFKALTVSVWWSRSKAMDTEVTIQ